MEKNKEIITKIIKYICALLVFTVWCITTLILVISIFGILIVVIDGEWFNLGEKILKVYDNNNNLKN